MKESAKQRINRYLKQTLKQSLLSTPQTCPCLHLQPQVLAGPSVELGCVCGIKPLHDSPVPHSCVLSRASFCLVPGSTWRNTSRALHAYNPQYARCACNQPPSRVSLAGVPSVFSTSYLLLSMTFTCTPGL